MNLLSWSNTSQESNCLQDYYYKLIITKLMQTWIWSPKAYNSIVLLSVVIAIAAEQINEVYTGGRYFIKYWMISWLFNLNLSLILTKMPIFLCRFLIFSLTKQMPIWEKVCKDLCNFKTCDEESGAAEWDRVSSSTVRLRLSRQYMPTTIFYILVETIS